MANFRGHRRVECPECDGAFFTNIPKYADPQEWGTEECPHCIEYEKERNNDNNPA